MSGFANDSDQMGKARGFQEFAHLDATLHGNQVRSAGSHLSGIPLTSRTTRISFVEVNSTFCPSSRLMQYLGAALLTQWAEYNLWKPVIIDRWAQSQFHLDGRFEVKLNGAVL
jgi:hypothetical protein